MASLHTEALLEAQEDKVEKCRQALALHPAGHPKRSASFNSLATALKVRFGQRGQQADLDEAIGLHRDALLLRPEGHPGRSASLNSLATALKVRFEQRGQQADIEEAIELHHDALSLRPTGHPLRSSTLNNLANVLQTRFKQIGQHADLDEAFDQRREQADLDEVIGLYRDALSLRPPGHSLRSSTLNNLANALQARFKQTGQHADLDEAIRHHRDALLLRPAGHPDHSSSLNNLASALKAHFEQRRQQADLDEVIGLYHDALSLRPPGHSLRSSTLNNLANALHSRFEQIGQQKMADIDEAIRNHREALSLRPKGHPDHSLSLSNLATALKARFERTGQQADLDEAIRHHYDALPLRPTGHPLRSTTLNNLATALYVRFNKTGQQAELDESIKHNREALLLRPKGHPDRSLSLNNLASALKLRFEQRGQREDLDEAIELHRDALSLRPADHPLRSSAFNNLANSLRTRFKQTGQHADLDGAIRNHRAALSLRPKGHRDRSMSLSNLAMALQARFEQRRKQADLDEVIRYHREALSLRPEGHPDRSLSLNNLAIALINRLDSATNAGTASRITHSGGHAEIVNDVAEVDHIINLLEDAVQHEASSLKDRLNASFTWIRSARRLRNDSIPRAYSAALALLARISFQRSTLESQHKSFSSNFYHIPKSFVSEAASSAIEIGMIDTAVEFLEQGRGILWSRMKGYRHPLLQLRATHPELAKRYETLSVDLERHATVSAEDPSEGSSVWLEAQWQEYQGLSEGWNKAVEEIRELDRFQEFLRPPTFSHLLKAAKSGPVILINVSKYRSDAIIVFADVAPALIPLPHFTPEDLGILVAEFQDSTSSHSDQKLFGVLKALWEMVVEPVVDYLKSHGVPIKSRIWWCPTSQLCALPIHAAGPYSAGNRSLSDLYVSSYTPTLSALISAREGLNTESAPMVPQLLVVGKTDGRSIPAVEEEVRRIQHLGPFVEVLSGEAASCENVVQALATHSWSHFACHGILDPAPFHSSFKLYNGEHLELIELIKARLPEAELAFLSACHAAAVHLEGAPDEVIHLSAAMQFCGFRSVVGTLWAMADEDGPDVAEDFYRYMLRDLAGGNVDFRDAATALNLATREMRRKRIPLTRWVNFVHIGA